MSAGGGGRGEERRGPTARHVSGIIKTGRGGGMAPVITEAGWVRWRNGGPKTSRGARNGAVGRKKQRREGHHPIRRTFEGAHVRSVHP